MIKLVNVSKYYNTSDVIALGLRKVNLEFDLNEFVAVVGESGSGKTTLLNVISGIDSYEEGEMYVNGKETSYFSVEDMENYRKKYVAFVFQNYNLIDSYTVLQNVQAPLILSGYPKDQIKQRALEIIKKVGLEKYVHQKSTKLSGGQKQRVVIARALAKDCPIIAADEPTGNLDSESAKGIIELLHEISKDKLVIVVTHDFTQLKEHATRKIRIYDGEVVEDRKIRKVDKIEFKEIEDKEIKTRFIDLLKISLRNLFSVPKKTLLMVLVFTFFSFFVAMAFGGYYITVNEMSGVSNHFFSNTNPNRIVVKKSDDSVFTQADLAELEAYNKVQTVMPYDYILDYRSNIFLDSLYYGFMFLPASLITQSDLNYGNMPANDLEVVIAVDFTISDDPKSLIGEKINYSSLDAINGSKVDYEISGVIDTSKLYISEDYTFYNTYVMLTDNEIDKVKNPVYYISSIKDFYLESSFVDDSKTYPFKDSLMYQNSFSVSQSLEDNEIKISTSRSNAEFCSVDASCLNGASLHLSDNFISKDFDNIKIIYDSTLPMNRVVLSQALYDQIFYDDIYQVSVLTNTDIDVRGLFNTIENLKTNSGVLKYSAVYPFDSEDSDDFAALTLLLANIGMIVLNAVVLIGSTLITYVIFRAIINTKLHDYAIFRTIGANKNTIRKFIYIENLYVVIVSYIIFVIVSLSLPSSINSINQGILYTLKVFNFGRYLIFFGLQIIMSVMISSRYCSRIFRDTVNKTLKTEL